MTTAAARRAEERFATRAQLKLLLREPQPGIAGQSSTCPSGAEGPDSNRRGQSSTCPSGAEGSRQEVLGRDMATQTSPEDDLLIPARIDEVVMRSRSRRKNDPNDESETSSSEEGGSIFAAAGRSRPPTPEPSAVGVFFVLPQDAGRVLRQNEEYANKEATLTEGIMSASLRRRQHRTRRYSSRSTHPRVGTPHGPDVLPLPVYPAPATGAAPLNYTPSSETETTLSPVAPRRPDETQTKMRKTTRPDETTWRPLLAPLDETTLPLLPPLDETPLSLFLRTSGVLHTELVERAFELYWRGLMQQIGGAGLDRTSLFELWLERNRKPADERERPVSRHQSELFFVQSGGRSRSQEHVGAGGNQGSSHLADGSAGRAGPAGPRGGAGVRGPPRTTDQNHRGVTVLNDGAEQRRPLPGAGPQQKSEGGGSLTAMEREKSEGGGSLTAMEREVPQQKSEGGGSLTAMEREVAAMEREVAGEALQSGTAGDRPANARHCSPKPRGKSSPSRQRRVGKTARNIKQSVWVQVSGRIKTRIAEEMKKGRTARELREAQFPENMSGSFGCSRRSGF